MNFTVDFEPVGRRGEFSEDDSLLDCARQLSVDLVSICGGAGSCERCKVQVISGEVSELSFDEQFVLTEDEITQGYRLACRAYPMSDVKLHVPPESLTTPQRTQVEGIDVAVALDPVVLGVEVETVIPTLHDQQADVENLLIAVSKSIPGIEEIDFRVLQQLSGTLRENEWKVKAIVRENEVVSVGPPGSRILGLAADIGTTKIAGFLIDLETGETIGSKGVMNPQISYGEDVVSRIVIASKMPKDAARLQQLLVDAMNEMALELCEQADLDPSMIVEAVFVGNTAIHHLVLGLPVKQLGVSPYIPAIDTAVDIKAREIGLKFAPGAYLHMLPNIAGYVGADHVSMILATQIADKAETVLAIDIGTNTEICLIHEGEMTSVSCASGPAFEGAHIKHGMRAAPGAIEYVRMVNGVLELQTIGGEAPVGICGSGILDIVAQLKLNNVLEQSGRFVNHSANHPMVKEINGMKEFILADRQGLEPITISQKDVRELQLAKAAIQMGIDALLDAAEIKAMDLDKVIIAGAFGTFIDVKSAVAIRMLPDIPLERFEQVGNAAGTGARMALLSKAERKKAIEIAERDGYIELAKVPDFNRKFAKATYL